jgi:hypothetical protein
MGSVFLYLAIVLMWLCVLVPMWLRRDRNNEAELVPAFSTDDTASDAGAILADEPSEGETLADPTPTPVAEAAATPGAAASDSGRAPGASGASEVSGASAASAADRPAASLAAGDATAAVSATAQPAGDNPVTPPPLSRADRRRIAARRRARLIARRRRRMLWSVLLVIASAVTAATGVVSWWGVLPSVFLLLGYLVMLRVAVRIDAERRAQAARARAERARRRRARREALALAAEQTAADILEFEASRRVELFDQYADPPRRAVGD